MSGVATAVVASAVIGGVVSKNASDKAARAQTNAANTASQTTRAAANQARDELKQLFPAAQQNAAQGFQGALDVFGQSVPTQGDVFTQGNVAAQQQILAGLPQIQNAILGGNVDLSALQPTQLSPDLGFMQQQLPQFINPFNQAQSQGPSRDGSRSTQLDISRQPPPSSGLDFGRQLANLNTSGVGGRPINFNFKRDLF